MRAGSFISGVSHVVLVALALLGTPKLFDNPELATIEVDLVRPDEAELKEKPLEEKPPDKSREQEKPPSFDPFAPQAMEQAPQAAAKKPEPPPKPPTATQQAKGPQVPPSPAP